MNKKPITEKAQSKSTNPPFYKRKWAIIVTITLLLILGWMAFSKISLAYHKNQAKEKVESVIAAVADLPGRSVSSKIEDAGCGTGNIKFGKRTICNYYGERVFIATGDMVQGKKNLDKKMSDMGYDRYTVTTPDFVFERILNRPEGGSLNYLNDKGDNLEIFAYNKATKPTDAIISNLQSYNLKDDEYVYGIVVQRVYKISDSFILR